MYRNRLNGETAEEWFQLATQHLGLDYKDTFPVENLIRLLSQEMPQRLEDGVALDDRDKFPEGESWVKAVQFGQKKLSLPKQVKASFARYLLDQVVSTDAIVELPGKDGTLIAIDVTINPKREQLKVAKIRGRPDPKDAPGDNRNLNIGKVRKALGIDKHLVLTLSSERNLLPSYETLVSNLQQFAEGPSITSSLNLQTLPKAQTIGGAYEHYASFSKSQDRKVRLTEIAQYSIQKNDHPAYTTQVLLNDPALRKFDSYKKAKGVAAKVVTGVVKRTPHYQIASSIEDILKKKGKTMGSSRVLDTETGRLTQDSSGFSIYAKEGENLRLEFQSNKLQCTAFNLKDTTVSRFTKYYQTHLNEPTIQANKNRGIGR